MPSEAEFLHRALFPAAALPADLPSLYEQARARFFTSDDTADLVAYIIEHRLDPEAIEYALRLRRGANGLTRRFQVLLTLSEARSAYDRFFVQRSPAGWSLWAAALLLGLRAAWKLALGRYLFRVHGLDRFVHV